MQNDKSAFAIIVSIVVRLDHRKRTRELPSKVVGEGDPVQVLKHGAGRLETYGQSQSFHTTMLSIALHLVELTSDRHYHHHHQHQAYIRTCRVALWLAHGNQGAAHARTLSRVET